MFVCKARKIGAGAWGDVECRDWEGLGPLEETDHGLLSADPSGPS